MEPSSPLTEVWDSPDPYWAHAEKQLDFYVRVNRHSRWGHYTIETAQLLAAAGTTVAAGIGTADVVTAVLAGLTLLLTGLRQVYGFREKWATMTRAIIGIEHEMNVYRLRLAEGPADGGAAAGRELVLRVDDIVAKETEGWAERLRATGTEPTPAG